MVLDIQRTTRKNMNEYQKKVSAALSTKKQINHQAKVNSSLNSFVKKFKYFRLSLYSFALASLLEIMLSGNFNEQYISDIKDEIRNLSESYRELFGKSSIYLEKTSNSELGTNALKWVGSVGEEVGKFIGEIPGVKKGPIDDFLQESGSQLQNNALEIKQKAVREFAAISKPGTGVFIEKMNDLIQIFNHTSQICFDDNKIYLLVD